MTRGQGDKEKSAVKGPRGSREDGRGALADVPAASAAESARAPAATLVATSAADSGPGTLRWALQTAGTGDTITFDTGVFPPGNPVTIALTSGSLPDITQGNLTIDASDAGVILDGSGLSGGDGFHITSNGNTIQGLQIVNSPDQGISLLDGAQNNLIGGDRSIGAGPMGQGNLISGNGYNGVFMYDSGTMSNTVSGNYIGTDAGGTAAISNGGNGVSISDGATNSLIECNIIAYNGGHGVSVYNPDSLRNTITQNSIHDNDGMGIDLGDGGNTELPAPTISHADAVSGIVTGTACAGCRVEIFSDAEDEGRWYEGVVTATITGSWSFSKGSAFTGPNVQATATDAGGNTSEFSVRYWIYLPIVLRQ